MTPSTTPPIRARKERDQLFKKIDKEIKAIETRHGVATARWALRRHLTEQAERAKLEKEKKRLEGQLAELNAR